MAKQQNGVAKIPDTQSTIDALNEKIESITRIRSTPYRTNGRINTAGGSVDVKTERDIDILVGAFASVMARGEQKDAAYTKLGRDGRERPLTLVDGFTVEDWEADVKLTISITEQEDDLNALNQMKTEWESLLDKEDKKKNLMKKMQKMVGRVGVIDIKDDDAGDTADAEVVE